MRLVQVITDYIRRSILTTKGDLVVRGDSLPERLPSGALNTYLRGKGAGQLPAYEAEPAKTAIRARLTSDQIIPTGVWTKLQFGTEDYDVNGEFDNVTNYRFTVTTAGKYLVVLNGKIEALADQDLIEIIIQKSGVNAGGYIRLHTGSATSIGIVSSDILSLSVSDYIEGFIRHNFGADRTAAAGIYTNYIAIHKLS